MSKGRFLCLQVERGGGLAANDGVVLRVNKAPCSSKEEATELIQSAFNHLTFDIIR